MKYLIRFITSYFKFTGRASKKEYRILMGIMLVIILGGLAIDIMLEAEGKIWIGFIFGILIPSYSASVRRLHDMGHSGYTVFTRSGRSLKLFFADGDQGTNEYGELPID